MESTLNHVTEGENVTKDLAANGYDKCVTIKIKKKIEISRSERRSLFVNFCIFHVQVQGKRK